MADTVRDVMTRNPVTLEADATLREAADLMRDRDIGDILVTDNGALCGVVTDRDIVIRGLAGGKDPASTSLREICSQELETLSADDPIERAVDLMMNRHVRRLPVVEHDRPIGIVAIGDLAVERDPRSALGHISAADPNR